MAITNEERREVAAMLREDIGLRTFAEIFGFSWTDESDWYWRDVTAKVADYVEPEPERTCRVELIDTGNEASYEHYEYIAHCHSCHHEFGYVLYNEDGDTWQDELPNFCPNCGCKVEQ